MKSLPFGRPARHLLLGVLGLLVLGRLLAEAPRLGLPLVLPNRVVQLSLTGQVGVAYSIQASSNLSNWFPVSTGIATNGWLTLRHDGASNYPTLFYRGTGPNDSLPPLTVALKPDTNIAVSALVSLDGGSAVLYGQGGIRFTLSLPSNSIPDASIITLTLVTNVTGLPFARGTLGTVLLEPADLAFWGSASLEVLFPSNIDRHEVISYATRGDGSTFHLTPDRVGTNRILIPVVRAGAYGSCLATTQELANAARLGTASGQGSGPSFNAASTAECFPEKQLAANKARSDIDDARAATEREVAALLGAERQLQTHGESDDSTASLAEVSALLCGFYTNQIIPRWPQATNNCALAKVLELNTLSVVRQGQLLGADPSDQCAGIYDIPHCEILQSCLDDIRQCCIRGLNGPRKVTEVLGLQRQQQLLGLECFSQDEAQEVMDLCMSNAWTGTFSMLETGSTETSTIIDGGPGSKIVVTVINHFSARFSGAVEESHEGGAPDFGYLVELRVVGQVVQHELHHALSESFATVQSCPGGKPGGTQYGTQLERTEHSAAGTTTFFISFITRPGWSGYDFFNALNYDPDNPDPPGGSISVISYQDDKSPCSGLLVVKNSVFTSASPYFGNTSPPETSGTMTDPKIVSGSITMDEPGDPPRHLEFRWNFTRHVVTP